MPTHIRLFPGQIADLAAIRDLGPERLQRVAAHLEQLEALPLRPQDLHAHVAESLDGDKDAAECVLRPILALYQLIRQRELTIDEVLEALRSGIAAAEPTWNENERAAWDAVEPQLRGLFQASAVRTVSKAIDLAYEYANLFQGARIVTDIRPVFNDYEDERIEIEGAVVSYTLRLHYDNREGNHSLSIALDEKDVRLLKRQCDRALLKAQFARTKMISTAGVPAIISGETSDESD